MQEKTPDAIRTPATEQLGAGGKKVEDERRRDVSVSRATLASTPYPSPLILAEYVWPSTQDSGKARREISGGRPWSHSERKAMNPIIKRRRMPMNQSSIMINMAHPYSCHLTWATAE